jgi:hypothetical protein
MALFFARSTAVSPSLFFASGFAPACIINLACAFVFNRGYTVQCRESEREAERERGEGGERERERG